MSAISQMLSHFNPRSPHGERHGVSVRPGGCQEISIHAPRTGSDHDLPDAFKCAALFQSTLPARGATDGLSPGMEANNISIHAPRTGSDTPSAAGFSGWGYFNPRSPHGERLYQGRHAGHHPISIHAPRTGSDRAADVMNTEMVVFQSTLPARGATTPRPAAARSCTYFNPRSPHGERRTHPNSLANLQKGFQSTLPARGATRFHQ